MPESEKDENCFASELEVEVCHAFPWEPAFHPLQKVIGAHDGDIRMAFAYVRKIAVDLLQPYVVRMKRENSFLIAAPEEATCDEALGELNSWASDFVYFHHGRPGVHQKEAPKWGGIMHSKVVLSLGREGDKNATAWLGSHNLSERALGGINAEIAIRISGPREHHVFTSIAEHLDWLRSTAEKWVRRPVTGDEDKDKDKKVLVLHVVKDDLVQVEQELEKKKKEGKELLIHTSIPGALDSTLPDGATNTRRLVHLHVYDSEKDLRKEIDPVNATESWQGAVTTDSDPEEDKLNPGAPGEFSEIGFEVLWPNEESPPGLKCSEGVEEGKGGTKQIVFRIDELLPPADRPIEYSTSRTKVIGDRKKHSPKRISEELSEELGAPPIDVPPVVDQYLEWELKEYDRKHLYFEGGLEKGKVKVTGFEDKRGRRWTLEHIRKLVPDGYDFEYHQITPKPKIQRYLYLSLSQWRSR